MTMQVPVEVECTHHTGPCGGRVHTGLARSVPAHGAHYECAGALGAAVPAQLTTALWLWFSN